MRLFQRAGSRISNVAAAGFLLCSACRAPDQASPAATAASASHGGEWFVDRAEQAGLRFVHVNGMSGQFYQTEIMAPGVALFDFDGDGDLDVYLVQGQGLPPQRAEKRASGTPGLGAGSLTAALFPPGDPSTLTGRLYRNEWSAAQGGVPTFTDVTSASGIVARGYGMGVAAGDVDNDGCVDLFLTGFEWNQLLRNTCRGTFVDVTKQSGIAGGTWSVSAAFVDIDRDGWLDLFVGHYLDYTLASKMRCFSLSGRPDYCAPSAFAAQPSRLYRNQRDGTFVDITATALRGGDFGPALGVATADFNGDGWIDIYVANDGQPNQLWINRRDGTFDNTALLAGVALTVDGKAEASMGVDAGDFDDDGDEDLFVTELTGEGNNLFVNDGSGTFDDRSGPSGLGHASQPYTGFGTAWIDLDNDGRLDLLTVNGAVRSIPALVQANDPFPLHQGKQLFRNVGGGRFEDVTAQGGSAVRMSEVSRGAAFGDVDNDGDTDVLVGNNSGKVRLLINEVGHRQHWVGLRLVGEAPTPALHSQRPGRDMLGARVEVTTADGVTRWRRARSDGSYGSANDPRVLVGLGASTGVSRVRVVWPSGRTEQWGSVPVDRYTTLKEGTGR